MKVVVQMTAIDIVALLKLFPDSERGHEGTGNNKLVHLLD